MKKEARNSLYLHLALDIERRICHNQFDVKKPLPSLNKMCQIHQVSFMTAFRIYDELVKRGIIRSIKGKGYFINQDYLLSQKKIEKCSPVKEIVAIDDPFLDCNYNQIYGIQEKSTEYGIFFRVVSPKDDLKVDYSSGIILNYASCISRIYQKLEYRRLRVIVTNNYFPELHCVIHDNFHGISNILDRMEVKKCRKILFLGRHFTDLGQANLNEREYAFQVECKRRNLHGVLLISGKLNEILQCFSNPNDIPDGIIFGTTTIIPSYMQEAVNNPVLLRPYKVAFGNAADHFDGVDIWDFSGKNLGRAAVELFMTHSDVDWLLPSVTRIPGQWQIQ